MNIFKKSAISAALAVGFVAGAQADVLSQSVLRISNFLVMSTAGVTLDASQFAVLVPTDSGDTGASLNVGGVQSFAIGPLVPGQTFDVPQACVGNCIYGANDFTSRVFPPVTTLARGDALLQGAPITGLIDPGTGNPITSPASADTVAEVQLTSSNGGSATSNLDLTTDFIFALGQTQAIRFGFDALVHVLASKNVVGIGSASSAASGWVLSITDANGDAVFEWEPDGDNTTDLSGFGGDEIDDDCNLQATRSRGALATGSAVFDCSGSFLVETGTLQALELYTLSLRHSTLADGSQRIPEPGSLALAGLAALGVAAFRRRRFSIG